VSDDPTLFYRDFVRRAYDEWLAAPLDEYRAKMAVHQANVMAERMWHYWNKRDPSKVFATPKVREYRKYLRGTVCQDFGLIWDVDDAHKHVQLNRASRDVTNASQTGVDAIGWDEGLWDETPWDGEEIMVIRLDNGTKRPLEVVLKNVIEMWETLLK